MALFLTCLLLLGIVYNAFHQLTTQQEKKDVRNR